MSAYSSAVLADSPTAYYRLGEPSGTTATDQTGNHNGTYVNAPTLGVTGASGDGDTAVTVNGSSQRVLSTTLGTIGANLVTTSWEWWVKTNTASTVVCFFGTVSLADSTRIEVFANTSEAISAQAGSTAFRLSGTSGGNINGKITTNIYDNAWHHCVLVIESSTTASFYVDGVSRTITYGTQSAITGSNFQYPLAIGARDNRNTIDLFTACSIDEFAVYPTRLSAARVAAHYSAATSTFLTEEASFMMMRHRRAL